jgi:hypothetical protein
VKLGYTGLLTAEHITSHFPADLKWAVAGRSAEKLKEVVSQCNGLRPDRVPPSKPLPISIYVKNRYQTDI